MELINWLKRLFNSNKKEEDHTMKYLVVGLGNMGSDYDDTRHNIGFEVVDALAKEFDTSFEDDSLGDIAEIKFKGRTLILLKPSTFMNISGKAVRYWMQKKKIPIERTLIILDDIHLDFKAIRIKPKGKDGGHNGLKSINQYLNSTAYARLKIGIGNNFHKGRQSDYVLGKWKKAEQEELPFIVNDAIACVKTFVSAGVQQAMSHNKKG